MNLNNLLICVSEYNMIKMVFLSLWHLCHAYIVCPVIVTYDIMYLLGYNFEIKGINFSVSKI